MGERARRFELPDEHHDQEQATTDSPYRLAPTRRRFRRVLLVLLIPLLLLAAAYVIPSLLYHGPRTLEDVVAVMPGVPVFPLSTLSPRNRSTQRGLAIPLYFARLQGAKHVQAALLQAPADDYFIAEWFRNVAPAQDWKLVGYERSNRGIRMVFLRKREGMQLIIGQSRDILTPIQYIYLGGLTKKQVRQLTPAILPRPESFLPAPEPVAPTPQPVEPTTPLTIATPGQPSVAPRIPAAPDLTTTRQSGQQPHIDTPAIPDVVTQPAAPKPVPATRPHRTTPTTSMVRRTPAPPAVRQPAPPAPLPAKPSVLKPVVQPEQPAPPASSTPEPENPESTPDAQATPPG